ncbi:MAG: riboflavin synthase, partial [Mycobacteriales bacterium]
MFTGIVEELGECRAFAGSGDAASVSVFAPQVAADLAVGGSVAVNGVCLTAVAVRPDGFLADVMAETLTRTTLGGLLPGAAVN